MVQYSLEILNEFGGPELSDLKACGAQELAKQDYDCLWGAAIFNQITGVVHPDASVRHLDIAFLRRTNAAAEEYATARIRLQRYCEGLGLGEHRLSEYFSALMHFEHCLNSIWEAAELFNRMEHKVQGIKFNKPTLYEKGKKSDLERINTLNNYAKHFNVEQAEQTSTPVWITNDGLKCAEAALTFEELRDNLLACFEVARQIFVEIPKEAHARKQHSLT